jgi:hypothetical protein
MVMDVRQSVEQMSDSEILAAFGMGEGMAGRGFDTATQARVFADELIRSRGRFAQYRALYAAFIEAGQPYMVENLDEIGDGAAVPAKLVFSGGPPGPEVDADPMLMVWTERTLLEALVEERAIQDFFISLLDELEPELAEQAA